MVHSRGGVPATAKENIRVVAEVERTAARNTPAAERISQAICNVVGSVSFVVGHLTVVVSWICWNLFARVAWQFDPFPWGLLNLLISLESVLVATFVLIAQNRMSRQSDERDHLNLQVDLLAEREMTIVLRLLRRIADQLHIEPDSDEAREADSLTQPTNVKDLVEALRRRQ